MYLSFDLWHSWRAQQYRMWFRNRQGVTGCLCECLCMCVFLYSSLLSEADWKGTQIKAVYFLLWEEKGEWAALLCYPSRSPPPPECQAHEWFRGKGRKREDGWHSFVLWTLLFLCPELDCGACLGFVSVFIPDRSRVSTDAKTTQQCLCMRVQKGF